MEGKLKISFIGDSHIAYWPFESYFPKWECYNYGVPGKGLDYVEMFHKDVSDSYVVVQLGTNDIYNLNTENMDVYVERYVKAVGAISSRGTYLFCIFPRNDFMDAVINIGDFSVSLYEGEQEILGKLDKMGLLYEKVEDSDNKKYDYYYNVGDGETQFIQVYFLEKECVRIRISSNETFAYISRGIYSGNTYSQMVEQYGDSYEKHTYMGKERYTIYRYALGECFHEFGIPGEATGEIYNVDVYVSGQMPIYDYGEEIVED